MGEIHELFVLPLSLVWCAGATPERMAFSFRAAHLPQKNRARDWNFQAENENFKRESGVARQTKPRKYQNEKFMNFALFCEFWCFSLGKQARFTLNFSSGMPLRKVHELTFLWFGLPGTPLREWKFRPKSFVFLGVICLVFSWKFEVYACAGDPAVLETPRVVNHYRDSNSLLR